MKKIKLILIFFSLIIFACNAGNENNTYTPPDNTPNNEPLEARLSSIQEKIFTPRCAIAGCHTGPTPTGNLYLTDKDTSWDYLLRKPTQGNITIPRVGNTPENSYLILKLEGKAGDRMPLGLPPLTTSEINKIKEWISNGANNN